ncbi:hypothetical protein D3C78_959680 [compost metagenome]
MANLTTSDTGVEGVVIWVSVKTGRERHGPRVMFQPGTKLWGEPNYAMDLTGTLRKGDESWVPTAVLAGVRAYVLLNKERLIDLWEGRIGHTQYGQRQQPLQPT